MVGHLVLEFNMLFNIFLCLSQATAEVDVLKSERSTVIEAPQHEVEDHKIDIRDSREERKDPDAVTMDVCGDIKGRKLFRNAIIGIPLGTLTTIAGGILLLASIDSTTSMANSAIGTVFTGFGILTFSAIALPVSAHILHRDAVQKGIDPVIPKALLYVVDGVIVLGVETSNFGYRLFPYPNPVIQTATLGLPFGYMMNVFQTVVILNSIRKGQERLCGIPY